MSIFPVKCVNCGIEWIQQEEKEYIICPNCGEKISMEKATEFKKDSWL